MLYISFHPLPVSCCLSHSRRPGIQFYHKLSMLRIFVCMPMQWRPLLPSTRHNDTRPNRRLYGKRHRASASDKHRDRLDRFATIQVRIVCFFSLLSHTHSQCQPYKSCTPYNIHYYHITWMMISECA